MAMHAHVCSGVLLTHGTARTLSSALLVRRERSCRAPPTRTPACSCLPPQRALYRAWRGRTLYRNVLRAHAPSGMAEVRAHLR